MPTLERRLKELARQHRGELLVGVAGPDRLDGPPSLDPRFTLPGARSVVSIAVPMDVPAIYDFLSKKTADAHNADQLHGNQQVFRITTVLAHYLESRGYRARAAPVNSDYRRSPDVLSLHPVFSHRFGAIAAGIGGQGWSGNVVTREFGAAVYLGTVVTDAVLRSDPAPEPRELFEERCSKCKICEKSCPVGMFDRRQEEQVMLNGQLYPRGQRVNVDLCTASCFGLHGLSRDKKWTTWSPHWIRSWIGGVPRPSDKRQVRRTWVRQAGAVGDSGQRQYLIKRNTLELVDEEVLAIIPPARETDRHQHRRAEIVAAFARAMGVPALKNINVLTCGQCSLVCGPTLKERGKRFKLLEQGGFVVPGPHGALVRVDSFAQAERWQRAHGHRASRAERLNDLGYALRHFVAAYFGLQPRSLARGAWYEAKRRSAIQRSR